MKVILASPLPGKGNAGATIEVAPGFERNWLFPQGLAFPFSKRIAEELAAKEESRQKAREEVLANAALFAQKISDLAALEIAAPASKEGTLFAGIGGETLAELLAERAGISLSAEDFSLPEGALKKVGEFKIPVRVDQESAELKVVVTAAE